MSPPERDASGANNLNADLNNVPLATNQSVHSESDTDDDGEQDQVHYLNGQVAYQQLGSECTALETDDPDGEQFDDFQLLAESRFNKENKRNNVRQFLISSYRPIGFLKEKLQI
jgi:hypothetical protein